MTGSELWERVEAYGTRTAHYFFGRGADAEDAVQDYAVLCLQFPAKYPDAEDAVLVLLVKRAMWNQSVDKKRRGPIVSRALVSLYTEDITGTDALDMVESNELFVRIHEELSDADRGIYFMQAWGYSRAEIGQRQGISDGVIWRSRLRLAEVAKRFGVEAPRGYST